MRVIPEVLQLGICGTLGIGLQTPCPRDSIFANSSYLEYILKTRPAVEASETYAKSLPSSSRLGDYQSGSQRIESDWKEPDIEVVTGIVFLPASLEWLRGRDSFLAFPHLLRRKKMTTVPEQLPARPQRALQQTTMGIVLLCIAAVAAQAVGLVSVIKYVTTREAWEAQKNQFSEVASEWEMLSQSAQSRISSHQKQEIDAEQRKIAAEKELEEALKKLAATKGELDAIQSSANSAVELQKRAQAEEQASLDSIQKLKGELGELAKQKAAMQAQIDSSSKELQTAQTRLAGDKATLESQDATIKSNEAKVAQLDASLKAARENLRKVSDELLAANNDVAAALEAKKEATVATEAAMKLAKDVEKLQQDQAKISGEIAALSMQKLELEKDLTTSDSRMNNARAKLAEYLDKWNNRDRLNQEVDQMSTRVNTLRKSESELTDGISRLTDQSIKLETKTKGLTQEIKNAEAQLADLKNQQKEALAELLELQKLKKEAEGKGDGGPGDEGEEGQND